VEYESNQWSGEGTFTAALLETLQAMSSITYLRVEDAPASRADEGFNFISNEIYVRFRADEASEPSRLFGIVPVRRTVLRPAMTLVDLEAHLTGIDTIGAPDYADEGMLQFLRTERITPPYQTRGYKVVELVRVYVIAPATAGAS